jgi:glycerol kinase
MLMNTGETPYITDGGLVATVAWQIGDKVTYALEGSVFTCGAAIQWLRDGLRIIESAQDSEYYARKVKDSGGVMVVPAFTGLGAPHWDPYARGVIIGISRATSKYHVIRATLESLAYQVADVLLLMENAVATKIPRLKVDGGAAANGLLLEFEANLLGVDIERPECIETTALGAAYLAGLTSGYWKNIDEIKQNVKTDREFLPKMDERTRQKLVAGWQKAVEKTLL